MSVTPLSKLCYIIIKAREFDAKVEPVEMEPGGNPADDQDREILEDFADDPTEQELAAVLDDLNEDERVEVLALVWLGRGDFDRSEWRKAIALARDVHDARETRYLMGIPQLGDFLEEGMAQFGLSCEDYEIGRL